MDTHLKTYIDKYDKWLAEKSISFSSKVIPVGESLDAVKQILPSRQAEKILENARLIAQADCLCRTRYNRCDKPRDVCMILNETGEKWIRDGRAREIPFDRAKEILKVANSAGLVHLTLYQPDHELFAFCSCCSCCCHDLQLVMAHGKDYILTKADYAAVDDHDSCISCGEFVARCQFRARHMDEGEMIYDPALCRGCGLCVTTCPGEAIRMTAV